jgi:diaminobutyrate-2-oxoglutarate transaminase
VIVETVQGEGGLNIARVEWLQALAELCRTRDILLIVDDVQMGCGRTGPFFSFEAAGIVPDIVTLSKSISGYGLPMALTLFRRELDVWTPGEYNGTFRGHNPAFVTATTALETYWDTELFSTDIADKGELIRSGLDEIADRYEGVSERGRGMAQGLKFADADRAGEVCRIAFDRGVLMETNQRTVRRGCQAASATDHLDRRSAGRLGRTGRFRCRHSRLIQRPDFRR